MQSNACLKIKHNIDSQIMDRVMKKVIANYGWGIPIHDAALISPAAAADCRKWYGEELEALHRDRDSVLSNYFKSIGINSTATGEWELLKTRVVPFEGELKVNTMALK